MPDANIPGGHCRDPAGAVNVSVRNSTTDPPWAAPALVTVIAALLAVVAWSPSAIGVFVDDGIYVLLGKAVASGEGLRYVGVAGTPPAPKYPPLYALLLAGVWKIGPSFPDVAPYLKAVGVVCAVVAAGAFAWYVQQMLRFPRWFAIGVTLLAWSTVDVWQYAVIPLSEPLFLLTLIICLAAAARSEERPNAWPEMILLLLAFTAAYYTRTTGVVLAVAVVGSHLLARRWRAAAVFSTGALLVMLPWAVWTRWAATRIPEPLADLLGGYGAHLRSLISQDPAGFVLSIPGRAAQVGVRVLDVVLPFLPYAVRLSVAPVLLIIAIIGGVQLWKRSPTLVLTLVGYAGVLCVWPFVARRLVAPVVPLLILLVGAGFYELHRITVQRRALRAIVDTVALLWVVFFAGSSAMTLSERGHDSVQRDRTVRLLWAAGAVAQHVPPTAVVVAPEFWAALHLYTGRTVAPSARFRPAAREGAIWGTPEEQLALWELVKAEYVLLEFGEAVHGRTLGIVQETCGHDAVQLVTRTVAMHLVRLNIDDRCRAALSARNRRENGVVRSRSV